MKRFIPFIVTLSVLFIMAAGCESDPVSTQSDESPTPSVESLDKKPVVITMLMAESDTEFALAKTQNFKEIQQIALERFNIDYRLETFISSEGNSVVSTRLASGVDLPDIINFAFSIEKLCDLYENNLILRLNDLIADNAPVLQNLLDTRPYVRLANSNAAGDILRMPANYLENPQHRMRVLHIRNDWLKMIGKDYTQIRTPDDLYEVLLAFQDQDVNGNGKRDEVMTASGANAVYEIYRVIGTAFGLPNASESANAWYYDSTGSIYNCNVQHGMLEMLTFLNKLYSEGLLDDSISNQSGDSYNQKLANNRIAVRTSYWWESVLMNMSVRDRGWEGVEYVPLARPLTAYDNPMVYLTDLPGYGGYMITKSCADPARLMQFLNWGYSDEGGIKNYYGVDDFEIGSDYFKKSVPLPGLTMPPTQMDATDYYVQQMKDEPLLIHKMGWNQEFTPKLSFGNADGVAQEFYISFTVEKCGLAAEIEFNKQGLDDAIFKYGIPACNFASPTVAESDEWSQFTDLWLFMDMTIARFITGQEPLDNWSEFVSECDALGLGRATALRQSQYERCINIMAGQ